MSVLCAGAGNDIADAFLQRCGAAVCVAARFVCVRLCGCAFVRASVRALPFVCVCTGCRLLVGDVSEHVMQVCFESIDCGHAGSLAAHSLSHLAVAVVLVQQSCWSWAVPLSSWCGASSSSCASTRSRWWRIGLCRHRSERHVRCSRHCFPFRCVAAHVAASFQSSSQSFAVVWLVGWLVG